MKMKNPPTKGRVLSRGATLIRRPHQTRMRERHLVEARRADHGRLLDALGSDNGALSVQAYGPTTGNGDFRVEAPRSIPPLRQHRLPPDPALWASLEAYYS